MKLKISKSFIWIGIGLGVFWWVIESIIRVVIFKTGNFMEELLTDDPNELWMRSVVTALFFSFGLLFQFTFSKLQKAHNEIKTLRGLFPICASCKKIRDDKGYWNTIEIYIQNHSEAKFSHGICPECMKKLYPEYNEED